MATTVSPDVRISVDVMANGASVELSDCAVATTSQVNEQVLVDLDERGDVVGIEVLRIDADLPFELLKDRYRVDSGVELNEVAGVEGTVTKWPISLNETGEFR